MIIGLAYRLKSYSEYVQSTPGYTVLIRTDGKRDIHFDSADAGGNVVVNLR